MKKNLISIISLLLVLCMVSSIFIACTPQNQQSDESNDSSSEIESESQEKDPEENAPTVEKSPESLIIENANSLANGVQAFFSDPSRTAMTFENLNMSLEYALSANKAQQVTSLKNKDGHAYITNTMDVFITMENGNTYYGSKSTVNAAANIYRFGYYFYEMRFEEQVFSSGVSANDTKALAHHKVFRANQIESYETVGKSLSVTNALGATDPYIIFGDAYLGFNLPASRYQFLKISMTADETTADRAELFIVAGSQSGYTSNQLTTFNIINDGAAHEYLIPLTSIPGYEDRLKGIRLDISGPGATYQIHSMELVSADLDGAPTDLSIARVFNTYSDKMHQVLQVAATKETSGITAIGFTTDIAADTVSSIIIMNKDGSTVTSLEAVSDWADVAAVGFDIKNAGIFGYILPYDGEGGKIEVTLSDNVYTVIQTRTPENGTIIPSRGAYNTEKEYYDSVVPYNQNDFYMGNRIYTDANHDFGAFLHEAYCETNPLSEKNFSVSDKSTEGIYVGYDARRGIYTFSVAGTPNFNISYFNAPNKHYNVTFSVRGDQMERRIYVMTTTTSGALESAVLLDQKQMILPVPLEVGKNFSEAAGERNLFNINDETYGETIFPMVIEANAKSSYTVLNIYQNWGNFPLKQISFIQFRAPYYHLSTGVTETNCILPWYTTKNSKSLNTLPDFRTMSAPFWDNQPQHNSCGVHIWLNYNDADGNHYITSENTLDIIDSYGPTYADVKMDYLSDDGKIKLSYTHTEMPQTDENRTFYEITYEVLEDVTINDFRNNFQFYSTYPNNPTGNYRKIGYLDENNECQVVDSILSITPDESGKNVVSFGEAQYYVLGNECPYFSFFDMDGADPSHQEGYANLAFLVYNYDFVIGGEESDASFMIVNTERKIKLTLDLGDVTLKKGDTFKINAILLPWGSQELDRDYADPANPDPDAIYYDTVIDEKTGLRYMDKNVRDVRENTLLNPVKLTAGENAAAIESVFVPKVRTTNGKSAEFTVTGGHNNIAVRAYGFTKLTVPKVEEFVNGEWVEYDLNSAGSPDSAGYFHYYDGYMVHYDADGTYSYSFVFEMDNGKARQFRISVENEFKGWPNEPIIDEKRPDLLDVFVDHQEIVSNVSPYWVSDAVVSEDDTYVSLFGTGPDALNHNGGKVIEGYLTGYENASSPVESGHLLVLKYRIPKTNSLSINRFDFFTSTVNGKPAATNMISTNHIDNDGEWHVIVIDLSKVENSTFKQEFVPDNEGKYNAQFIRFDFFDKCMNTTDYIDVAYFGLDNSLEDIIEMLVVEETNFVKQFTLIEGSKKLTVNVGTGNIVDNSAPKLESFIHPDCGEFTVSDLDYASCVDGINGKNIGGGSSSKLFATTDINTSPITLSYGSTTIVGPEHNNPTTYDGTYLVISGWTVIDGGVEKYVWSADGGKTWNDCVGFKTTVGPVSNDHLTNASRRIGKEGANSPFTTDDDKVNGLYQGLNSLNPKGIAADLKDYVGKTAHVIFAAVPAKATDTLCLIAYVTDVKVVAEEEVVKEPVYNDYVKEGSGYSVSDLQFAACIDRVCSTNAGNHINSNSASVPKVSYNKTPIASATTANSGSTPGNYLIFSGWAIVRGGIEKYVWSADGGYTWYEIELYNMTAIPDISTAILNHDRLKNLGYTFLASDGKNCMFQSSADGSVIKGLAANLENYSGQTVDVIFAAVPSADTETLCVISVATGVQVP